MTIQPANQPLNVRKKIGLEKIVIRFTFNTLCEIEKNSRREENGYF
ncbi:hypothetical protein Cabys_1559 [Caldithrix abyssi DSM 13497]|uniref:Uncharacterized protein n=1 Tax=Caldithrix abyssi DSM 13497 TaxID=880073 RepID=A0A1J1C7D3_CALAY|nr:hypothetical protein Cabys_1559 [Caldithrix abyssi DSM 13497]